MQIGEFRHIASRHRGLTGMVIGVVAGTTLAGGGVALAAIPSTSTGQYTACVHKKTGGVRIIDFQAGKRCNRREKTVSWSKGWRHRGTWSASVAYAVGDVVVQNGSSFVAKTRSTGKAPSANRSAWGLLARAATAGAPGPAGPAGTAGQRGPAGPVGLHYVQSGPDSVPAGEQVSAELDCDPGESVTGGGVFQGSTELTVNLESSFPVDDASDVDSIPNNGWFVDLNNASATASEFSVYAICTTPTSITYN